VTLRLANAARLVGLFEVARTLLFPTSAFRDQGEYLSGIRKSHQTLAVS